MARELAFLVICIVVGRYVTERFQGRKTEGTGNSGSQGGSGETGGTSETGGTGGNGSGETGESGTEGTGENRQMLLEVANNSDNYLGRDARGNDWYASIADDGTQTWVRVRNGVVDNAGVNKVIIEWDPETGLYRNTKK